MTTHLSVRLAWHDRGWDGKVCDAPHLNAHCIIHKHIRDSRDDNREREVAGTHIDELNGWLPPCSRDMTAYADRGFENIHRDPLEFRRLPPVRERIPSYSSCQAPYRWMREEFFQDICEAEDLSIRGPDRADSNSWVFEPDRQRELLKEFWGKLERNKSLVFYYCNHGNPLDENASRIIIGVGKIARISPQIYFGTKPEYPGQYPVWSRCITQAYPEQGVRIPYQEYLRGNHVADPIVCKVPLNARLPFSYGAEHVSDDVAVAILERVIQSIERVSSDGYVPGDWEKRLSWLNDALAETWSGRGPFPGTGSVLRYLGFSKGISFQRTVLAPMARNGENPWSYVLGILDGKIKPEENSYRQGLKKAGERWRLFSKPRHELLSKLARFELSPDQVERIASPDRRAESGFEATEDELVENPYILSENDLGTANSDPVALETIDHGLRPEGDAAFFPDDDEMLSDDRRRVRAVGIAILREAAEEGDTVLTFTDFLNRIRDRFPELRACRPDRDVVRGETKFYEKLLWMALDSGPELVALKHLQSLEQHIASMIKRRAKKENSPADPPIDWIAALKALFGDPISDRERKALEEKQAALEKLFSKRLGILTGGAGTGKTSVLKVFLEELARAEGRHPVLLLAPTGKARVRLSTKTGRNAMTIHQFLLKQGWFIPDIFVLKSESSKSPFSAATVIIDECSMIPTDLFGTLLRAVDPGPLSRLILVGDPNQLPPIGPGRPFADIIEWLQKECPDRIAPLSVCMRTDEEKDTPARGDSVALALADGYRASVVSPGDDEILAAVARGESAGDLEVVFWNSHDELIDMLRKQIAKNLGIRNGDYKSFNRSLGIDAENWERSEAWQILCPTRNQHFGTEDLNRLIQMEYKGGLIKNPRPKSRPFGEKEIVWTDKFEFNVKKVRMRDGINLSANIWRPDAAGRFPVVYMHTSYDKSAANMIIERAKYYVPRGYVLVAIDARGRHDSDGVAYFYWHQNWREGKFEGQDVHDCLTWLGEQPWSTGKTGMTGPSGLGYYQWMGASLGNPYLTTIVPYVSPDDAYENVFPNGAFQLSNSMHILAVLGGSRTNSFSLETTWDWGKLVQHLPLRTMDEAMLGKSVQVWQDFMDHPDNDYYWRLGVGDRPRSGEMGPGKYPQVKVPTLSIAGWYDQVQQATINGYLGMRRYGPEELRDKHHLVAGPWRHSIGERVVGDLDFGPGAGGDCLPAELHFRPYWLKPVEHRWFDYWLQGLDNGMMDESPVHIFRMGENAWRAEDEWPLSRARELKYYLHSSGHANSRFGDGTLSPEPPAAERTDTFVYDPEDPVPSYGGIEPWQGFGIPDSDGPRDQRVVNGRNDVLVYRSEPRQEDLEVTGRILCRLYAASTARDTDF